LLAEHAWRRIGDDEMKAVVGEALAVGFLVIIHHARAQTRAARLQRERQYGGVAAGDRRARAGEEIVRHLGPAERRLGEMHVAVDPAWHHAQPGGVDLARGAFDAVGNSDDAAGTHADVGTERVARGGDGAAADREVIIGHWSSPGRAHAILYDMTHRSRGHARFARLAHPTKMDTMQRILALVILALLTHGAAAQSWPSQPVR